MIGCGRFDIPMELAAVELWKRNEPDCKVIIVLFLHFFIKMIDIVSAETGKRPYRIGIAVRKILRKNSAQRNADNMYLPDFFYLQGGPLWQGFYEIQYRVVSESFKRNPGLGRERHGDWNDGSV